MQLFLTVIVVSGPATKSCGADYFERKFSLNLKLEGRQECGFSCVQAAVRGGDGVEEEQCRPLPGAITLPFLPASQPRCPQISELLLPRLLSVVKHSAL